MKALYAGSFNPFTLGHLNIALRAAQIFDELVVGVAHNVNKDSALSLSKRMEIVKLSLSGKANNIIVAEYLEPTTDFALKLGCNVIVRGVRNTADYEHEKALSRIYKELSGIETVLLFSSPQHEHLSSTLVRELISFNKDIDSYVDSCAKELILNLYKKS